MLLRPEFQPVALLQVGEENIEAFLEKHDRMFDSTRTGDIWTKGLPPQESLKEYFPGRTATYSPKVPKHRIFHCDRIYDPDVQRAEMQRMYAGDVSAIRDVSPRNATASERSQSHGVPRGPITVECFVGIINTLPAQLPRLQGNVL